MWGLTPVIALFAGHGGVRTAHKTGRADLPVLCKVLVVVLVAVVAAGNSGDVAVTVGGVADVAAATADRASTTQRAADELTRPASEGSGTDLGRGGQDLQDPGGVDRMGQQVALGVLAAEVGEDGQVVRVVDALGQRRHA